MGDEREIASAFFLMQSPSEGAGALILIGVVIALGFIAVYFRSRRK